MNLDAVSNMLEMQHRMNTRVHEQWIDQGFEWYRAVWIECGELMDHVGYKLSLIHISEPTRPY